MRLLSRLPERSMFGLWVLLVCFHIDIGSFSLLQRGRKARDPAAMALERTSHHQLLRHVGDCCAIFSSAARSSISKWLVGKLSELFDKIT